MKELILYGLYTLTVFIGGFFLGHYKREGKLPEAMPGLPNVKDMLNAVMPTKDPELTKEELKANSFFN